MPRTVCAVQLSFFEDDWLVTRKENYENSGRMCVGYLNPKKTHVILQVPWANETPVKISTELHMQVMVVFVSPVKGPRPFMITNFNLETRWLEERMDTDDKIDGLFHLVRRDAVPCIPMNADHAFAYAEMMMTIRPRTMLLEEICVAIPYDIFQKSAQVADFIFRQPNHHGELHTLFRA